MSTYTRSAEAEVRDAFDAYELALRDNDVDALIGFFWDSEETVRFGADDEEWGAAAIRDWRMAATPVPAGRTLSHTRVVVLDGVTALVTTLFTYPGREGHGRQSQTWFRFSEGWRIVSAHVSQTRPTAAIPASGERAD